MSRRALAVCSTGHQLVMAQAAVRRLRERYGEVRGFWIGNRPLESMAHLLVDAIPFADLHGWKRIKPWTGKGRDEMEAARRRLRRLLGEGGAPADVLLGNDNSVFARLAMEASGTGWDGVVLYEEGIGLYTGSRRYAEKTAATALMALRGIPHRLFWRDFSRNRRIRRIACNHPWLLQRPDAEVVDTGAAYRELLGRIAERAGPAERSDAVDCVYVSGTLSEAGHVTFEQELELLAALHEAIRRQLGPPRVHIRFHPLDSERKRRKMKEIGYVEAGGGGPFEIDCLRRTWRNVVSFRSSVLLNLALLDLPETRCRVILGRGAVARKLSRGRIHRLFEALVDRHERFSWFHPEG